MPKGYVRISIHDSLCPSGCTSNRSLVLPNGATSASAVAVACPECGTVMDIATLTIQAQYAAFDSAAAFLEATAAERLEGVPAPGAATPVSADGSNPSSRVKSKTDLPASPDGVLEPEINVRDFALVVRLSPDEANLLASAVSINVGEPVRDRRRNARFSVRRLRRPYFNPAGSFEVFAELVRHRASRQETVFGFSLGEVRALDRGLRMQDEIVCVQDKSTQVVGYFRMPRISGKRPGAVELYRLRELPRHLRVR